jgi:uncharacterized protein (TIGR00369 family)
MSVSAEAEVEVDQARTRQVTWTDPMVTLQRVIGMTRDEMLAEFSSGAMPRPPIGELLGIDVLVAEPGHAVVGLRTGEYLCNPFGIVAGGVVAAIMDAAMWLAFQSALEAKAPASTTNMTLHFVRHLPATTGEVRAEASAIHVARTTGTAEARLVDSSGKLYAHATAGFVIAFDPAAGSS